VHEQLNILILLTFRNWSG